METGSRQESPASILSKRKRLQAKLGVGIGQAEVCTIATAPSRSMKALLAATLPFAYSSYHLGKQMCCDEALPLCCKMLTIWPNMSRSAAHVGHNNLDAACF